MKTQFMTVPIMTTSAINTHTHMHRCMCKHIYTSEIIIMGEHLLYKLRNHCT